MWSGSSWFHTLWLSRDLIYIVFWFLLGYCWAILLEDILICHVVNKGQFAQHIVKSKWFKICLHDTQGVINVRPLHLNLRIEKNLQ